MKERVLTAVVLLLIVVGALFLDPTGWAVKVLIVVVASVCGWELGKLTKTGELSPVIAGVAIFFSLMKGTQTSHLWIFAVTCAISAPLLILCTKHDKTIGNFIFGSSWVWASMWSLYILAASKSPSTWPLLLTAAIPIWCGDTAAIFVGKAFGKHKLAPSISPNKTWEGSIGNLLACIGAALALGAIFHYPMPLMLLLGINCGILGQAGDLFESWLKRKADVKDSGNILPGHGGLLDRLDSLMATAPISLLILQSLVVSGKPT